MISPRRLRKPLALLALSLLLVAVGIGALVATGVLAQPSVTGVQSDWGAVTDDTTEIRTTATVENPNPVGVPGVVDVSYEATLGGVVLARGERNGVGFGPGTNRLRLSAEMSNTKIADWWVAHVNGGERSELAVDATVSGPGFSREVPAQSAAIETDVLGGFADDEDRTVEFLGDPFLVVGDQTAAWGEADETVTPLTVSSTVENVHDYDVALDGVAYEVELNGVTLADGRQRSGVTVRPGERDSFDVRVPLDSSRMADWWSNHLEDGERSTLSVRLYGLVERDGAYERVPLRIYERSLDLETDMLGGGSTSVTPGETPAADISLSRPRLLETTREWGDVGDDTTEIETVVGLNNTNRDERVNDLIALDVEQATRVNGVLATTGGHRTEGLESGRTEVAFTSTVNNSKVPAWWARHLNAGERSTVASAPTARADLGFTRFDIGVDNRTSAFETDVLAGLRGEESETVEVDGEPAVAVTRESVSWGTATPETAPIDVEATLENERSEPVTVTEIRYRVAMNDVVLANRTAPESYTVAPGATEPVAFTMELDNGKMADWWPGHVRRGESSAVVVSVHATVETADGTRTVPVELLSSSTTVETDVLGDN